MTLANMRAQGVRSLWVICVICRHEAVLNVDTYDEATTVPSFGPFQRPSWRPWPYLGASASRAP
jgi:hypothetical protein